MQHHALGFILIMIVGASSSAPFDGTLWDNPSPSLPPGVTHGKYRSTSMATEIGYNVYLPPEYGSSHLKRFPIIYFLHGRAGDENTELEPFRRFLESRGHPNSIIVFPNGGSNSKYIDATRGSRMHGVIMTETAIIHELIPHIDATYRTISGREGRAIQGFSMGGMGALRLAFKYPELFGSVYSFSRAVDDDVSNIREQEPDLLASMLKADPLLWEQEMAKTLAVRNAGRIRNQLRIDLLIGDQDLLLPSVQELADTLDKMALPHSLHIVAGLEHSYTFGPNLEVFGSPR